MSTDCDVCLLQGYEDYSCSCFDEDDLEESWEYGCEKPDATIPQFTNLVHIIMGEENLHMPQNAAEALSFYLVLAEIVSNIDY